ncbi:unnamed protein product [Mytilus coruscus]|uniref:IgGFc-binding protein N-terminal domain-containing protein n=1 Tax=Mytilus coruscus TaxID=42192 RepID=A0A6J8BEJ9_MYTCO|nr:unnamed protein product [Mytilus coruscus]
MMLITLGLITLLSVSTCDDGSLDFVLVPIDTGDRHTIVHLETQTYSTQSDPVILNISMSTREIIERFDTLEAVSYQFQLSDNEIPQYGVIGDTAIYIRLSGIGDITGVTLKARFNDMATITVYPTLSLGSQYKIISYCQILGSCHVGFAGLNDNSTNIKIVFPHLDDMEVDVNGTTYHSGDIINVQLTYYQAFWLECIECELTNTIIDSSGPLAVFSGGSGTVVRKGVIESTFLTQMPPLSTWGKEFLLVNSNIDDGRDIYRIVSRFSETTVNIDGFDSVTFGDRNHWIQRLINIGNVLHIVSNKPILICQLIYDGLNNAAMVVVPPVEQYSNNSFSLPCHDNVHLLFEGNSWNAMGVKGIENGTLSIVSNSRFVARSFDPIRDSNALCHIRNDGSVFALVYVNMPTSAEAYIDIQYINGYSLKDLPLSSPKTVISGDLVDNDGDGKIDEDDCSAISDGMYDCSAISDGMYDCSAISDGMYDCSTISDDMYYCSAISDDMYDCSAISVGLYD